jgi:hypothetical protein
MISRAIARGAGPDRCFANSSALLIIDKRQFLIDG